MSKNIDQVFIANPITSNAGTDLMYFGQSPYGAGNDAAMLYSNFKAQFTLNVLTTKGDILAYDTAPDRLAVGGTNGQVLQVNSAAAIGLSWSTAAYPATTTINQILYSSAANTVTGIATANNGTLITSAGGVPSISSTLPTAVQANITQLGTQTQALNMGTNLINNVTDPVNAQDAATKNYVNTIAAGLNPITGVQAATTANLNATYSNGTAGVGATLTNAGTLVAFAVDGYSASLNDRILIKNQTSTFQNGIYTVTTLGSGSVAWVLTRATDYNTPAQISVGDITSVENGTTNGLSSWYQTATVVTIGTSPITFSVFFNPASYVSSTLSNGTIYIGNVSNVATQSTSTWPATTTINQILYSSAANTISGIVSINNAILQTNGSGVPSFATSLPSGLAFITTVDQTSASVTLAVNTQYITDNGASLVTYTLPTTAAIGSIFKIRGFSSGGWKIAQSSGQQIHVGSSASTSGATGSIASSNQYDCVDITCVAANNTFVANAVQGNLVVT